MSVPKVWSRFSSKTKEGTELKFRIEQMTDDKLEDVLNLVFAHFVTEESLHRAAGISKNPEAMREARELLKNIWVTKNYHIDVCISDDGTESEKVVLGASLMVIARKENMVKDKKFDVQTEELQSFFKVVKSLLSKFNVLEKYELDSFYDDRGVVVLPKYRGLGIAQEFFRVRRFVCKEHNIPMTAGWMTSFGSQKAAKRDGWEIVYEISFEEFGKEVGVVYKDVPETCIFMIARDL